MFKRLNRVVSPHTWRCWSQRWSSWNKTDPRLWRTFWQDELLSQLRI